MLIKYTAWVSSLLLVATVMLASSCTQNTEPAVTSATASDGLDRTVLPIVEPKRVTYKELDVRSVKPPARWEVKAPKGAPNIVVVLIDDMGFGASSTFGGPINMPTLEKISSMGLKYNRFHTT